MSSTITTGLKRSFTAGGAISQYRAVQISGSVTVIEADDAVGTKTIGIAGVSDRSAASGESVTIALANAGGTAFLEMSEAVTAGTAVYATTNGKGALVATTSNDALIGLALTSASADGDVIEVLQLGAPSA